MCHIRPKWSESAEIGWRETSVFGTLGVPQVMQQNDVARTPRVITGRARQKQRGGRLFSMVRPPNLWKRFDGRVDLSASGSGAGRGPEASICLRERFVSPEHGVGSAQESASLENPMNWCLRRHQPEELERCR